jgi:acetyl esterase
MSRTAIQGAVAGAVVRALFSLPDPVLDVLGGRRPGEAAGLAPDAWLLAKLGSAGRTVDQTDPPAVVRERFVLETAMVQARAQLPVAAEERTCADLPARLYVPQGVPAPAPLLVYYHGGGWVIGSSATHDASCRLLAHEARVRVLSVDYRLAPEHPWPAAAEDAHRAFTWAVEHARELGADPERIAVGGDSAGGNLAAVVARRARDAGGPLPAFQLLIYPATDFSRPRRASHQTYGAGYLLTTERMDWFEEHYVPAPADKTHPDASPQLADDLAGLPPAHIATAEADPLRDEGEAYAEALRRAGVTVSVRRHPHLHGFFNMTVSRSARNGVSHLAGVLQHALRAGEGRTARSG